MEANWFSIDNISRVYSQFLSLDLDEDGLLSKSDLIRFSGSKSKAVQLTDAAVDRIFEECLTSRGSGKIFY
jgi:Ca2+-binding EF-hand superfamily protein